MTDSLQHDAGRVVAFWREAGPQRWFRKSEEFDRDMRERFLPLHELAASGSLDDWAATAEGALALLILLDQFPRNAFRGTARMYATDEHARRMADRAIEAGLDAQIDIPLRAFFYLPYSHSESLADQRRAVALQQALGGDWLWHARDHAAIIERFGRFPHRNPILGRETTEEERKFLEDGGFSG